jgi:hypothetical protein
MFKFRVSNVPSVCKLILVCNAAGVCGGTVCSVEQQMHTHHFPFSSHFRETELAAQLTLSLCT